MFELDTLCIGLVLTLTSVGLLYFFNFLIIIGMLLYIISSFLLRNETRDNNNGRKDTVNTTK